MGTTEWTTKQAEITLTKGDIRRLEMSARGRKEQELVGKWSNKGKPLA